MKGMLAGLFAWASTGFISRALAGAGLAIAGTYTFGQFINYFINKALSQLSSIPMVGLIGVAGIDDAISIMITAVMIRLYLYQITQTIGIVKGAKK